MDIQKISFANADNICKLCNMRPRQYTCPRCDVGYCNVDCYKSEAHLECSESFYKQCVEDELKLQERGLEGRQKMIEILKRVHEQDLINMQALESDEEDEEDEEEEILDEQLDSDDDEDVPDLEKRLHDINLDNADEVWSALTDAEKQEFEALIKNGDIEKLLPQWVPWWTYHTKKKLVQEMDQKNDEETKELPPLIDVPIFNELQKASPNVQFNVINVIYAYAYIANYYNGDYLNCPVEAMVVFLDLCDNMKLNKVFENPESAITSVVHKIISCNWLPQDEQTLLGFKEAGNMIMQGPEKKNKYLYIAVAFSELHRLLIAAKEELSKNRNKIRNKEFSKKFTQRYNMENINLSKKVFLLYCKKLEYYLSWTKSCHANMST
ncbi:PREDICTED: zinc finger HIT domain-containing protein 2 [Habropoda laboriosa]|uniref:zinc finger HIT domain-containing protein 2 n=1 Tax=Habropoda laboriosa TaxID=597456 RepID=UPI00083DF982|nr:PREDICTED: zinc finger HIT domain-containing protein 2 [Habropoda laboriosa]